MSELSISVASELEDPNLKRPWREADKTADGTPSTSPSLWTAITDGLKPATSPAPQDTVPVQDGFDRLRRPALTSAWNASHSLRFRQKTGDGPDVR